MRARYAGSFSHTKASVRSHLARQEEVGIIPKLSTFAKPSRFPHVLRIDSIDAPKSIRLGNLRLPSPAPAPVLE